MTIHRTGRFNSHTTEPVNLNRFNSRSGFRPTRGGRLDMLLSPQPLQSRRPRRPRGCSRRATPGHRHHGRAPPSCPGGQGLPANALPFGPSRSPPRAAGVVVNVTCGGNRRSRRADLRGSPSPAPEFPRRPPRRRAGLANPPRHVVNPRS